MLAGLLPIGKIFQRDIRELTPDDVRGYDQFHFFAGLGGWPLALEMAGWNEPCWTGSCPCQPFSAAGKRRGFADERHLWPHWLPLIEKCNPPNLFGEQVASGDGREWFSRVRLDLENMDYVCGCADLCAAGVSAPHIRQRLYWVADSNMPCEDKRSPSGEQPLRNSDSEHHKRMGFGFGFGLEGSKNVEETRQPFPAPWSTSKLIACPDGLRRVPVEPSFFPLANGVSRRMERVRAAGNAIIPQVAAEFVNAFMLARDDIRNAGT